MKIKNLAFFGIMAAIMGVAGTARADTTTVIASQAYVDAKDDLKQDNLGGGDNAGKVVTATADAGRVEYRAISSNASTAGSTDLLTADAINTAISTAVPSASNYVSSTITDGVTDKAPSEDAVHDALAAKQDALSFDSTPTANSTNPVTSGGVKTALDAKQNTLTFDDSPTANSNNPVKSGGVKTALDAKQGNLGGGDNAGKVVTATDTAGDVEYTGIDTAVTANSTNLVTSGAVSTAIGNASSAVNSAYADNALDASGLAASSELAKMEAIQDTVARQGTFDKAWSDEFNSTDIGDSGATNLYAASKNSNGGSDMDNYVPTVKAVEKRLNGATTSDLAKLHNVSADASELNILDGATVTTAELNILDGVTATTTEINKLAGLTADTTELNYVDGVTSNIQTQLDAKQGTLTFDDTPTDGSANPVKSGGVYTALAGKQASFNDGTQNGTGLVKTVSQNGGTVSATASLGVYVSDMNNALKGVSSNSTAACTKGSPCTLTYYKDGTNEYMRWTPMDTESTDADTTTADSSNASNA